MKSNRRNFLKLSGLAGISLASADLLKSKAAILDKAETLIPLNNQSDHFNMSGFAIA